MSTPVKIYLHRMEHDEGVLVTWCQHRIDEEDVEYILSSYAAVTINETLDQLANALEQIRQMKVQMAQLVAKR